MSNINGTLKIAKTVSRVSFFFLSFFPSSSSSHFISPICRHFLIELECWNFRCGLEPQLCRRLFRIFEIGFPLHLAGFLKSGHPSLFVVFSVVLKTLSAPTRIPSFSCFFYGWPSVSMWTLSSGSINIVANQWSLAKIICIWMEYDRGDGFPLDFWIKWVSIWFKIERKTVTTIIFYSICKEMYESVYELLILSVSNCEPCWIEPGSDNNSAIDIWFGPYKINSFRYTFRVHNFAMQFTESHWMFT